MHFKDFITQQRVIIFVVGVGIFILALTLAEVNGYASISSELFINLAASSVTIVFTSLIIDYFRLREETSKTQNVANLAEDEIKATCFRIKWRLARLYGLERRESGRGHISNHEEAQEYLSAVTSEVDTYLADTKFNSHETTMHPETFPQYLERLQSAQSELERTLILYEYAMSYSLREHVLALRSELQIADRLLSFMDVSESFSEANLSLIDVTSQSVYDATEAVLGHDTRSESGVPLHAKDAPLR